MLSISERPRRLFVFDIYVCSIMRASCFDHHRVLRTLYLTVLEHVCRMRVQRRPLQWVAWAYGLIYSTQELYLRYLSKAFKGKVAWGGD